MATVLLGSNSPKQAKLGASASVNGEEVRDAGFNDLPEKTIVLIDTPDTNLDGKTIPLDKRLAEIRSAFALHSGVEASWVEGTDEDFTKTVSQVFGCAVGRPDGWDSAPEKPQGPNSSLSTDKLVSAVQKVQTEAKEVSEKG